MKIMAAIGICALATFAGEMVLIDAQAVIGRDFFMSSTEITQNEYRSVMGFNPSFPLAEFQGADMPVNCVSWYDAVLYCNKRSKQENLDTAYTYTAATFETIGEQVNQTCTSLDGISVNHASQGYRLPTSAEWKYAYAAGTQNVYAWGNDPAQAGDYAWYIRNSQSQLHSAGGKLPNEFGLYDMAGNVGEWCDSDHAQKYKVKLGGDAFYHEATFRADHTSGLEPSLFKNTTGFRVVRTSN